MNVNTQTSVIVVLMLLYGLVTGCKQGSDTAKREEIRIGYFANVTHAQAVLGVSSGEFANALGPAKLKTKVFNAGPALIEALFAGEIDIGYIGPGPALNGYIRSRGEKIRVISGAAANGVLVIAAPDSGINSVEDLRGKRIATPQFGNTQDIAAKHYLREVLKQSDVSNIRPVPNAEQAAAMINKQIDAAWAPEPWGSLLIKQVGAKLVVDESTLWSEGNFATTVVITTPEFLQSHPAEVEKILKVHTSWTQKLKNDPAGQLPSLEAALFALTNKALPEGVLAASVKTTTFTDDPFPHTFAKFAKWSYDLELTNEQTDPKDLFDLAILKKVQAAAPSAATTQPTDATAAEGKP